MRRRRAGRAPRRGFRRRTGWSPGLTSLQVRSAFPLRAECITLRSRSSCSLPESSRRGGDAERERPTYCGTRTGIMENHAPPLIATIVLGIGLAFVFGTIAQPSAGLAAGRIPARRGRGRPVHAGLCRRPEPGAAAGRDRRHPADVRGGPAFLDQGSAVDPGRRDPRGAVAGRRVEPVRVRAGPAGGAGLAAPRWCSASRCRWPAPSC